MESQQTFQLKKTITILAIVALICEVFSSITYFAYYEWNSGSASFWRLTFEFPGISNFISLLIRIAPYIIFVIYILSFYQKSKASVLVPVIFGLIALTYLFDIVRYYIILRATGLSFITYFLMVTVYTLATIAALKGFSKKIFLIIATATGLLVEIISLISFFLDDLGYYLGFKFFLYLFTRPIGILGAITFFVALFLFGLKNRIPAILSPSSASAKKTTPEQELKSLKEKFDLGIITEEEYRTQRSDIISRL